MGKRVTVAARPKGEGRHQNTVLILISAAFLAGGILGYLAQENLPASSYVQMFLSETGSPDLWRELWSVVRWPTGFLILGKLPLVGLSIPMAMSLRGFLLSYSIAAFAEGNLNSAVLLFGPTCVLTLPVLFLLSTEILLRKAGEQAQGKPAVILACVLSLCLCMVIDLTVVPMLLT
ncbi:MAG: hypothetical protein IKU62_04405 [Ruminiclostridium sp.]|nr:hypothetical protein [Ruminiclostridium sp.]